MGENHLLPLSDMLTQKALDILSEVDFSEGGNDVKAAHVFAMLAVAAAIKEASHTIAVKR